MTEAIEVAGYLRLRQICLVAPHLEPLVGDIAAIMGLTICYRDGNVAKYGLENALLPVDTVLLEVVAPLRSGTAAGRFLDKTGGRGGYMAIFACDDPDRRAAHAKAIGVRVANIIDHPPYHGVQLHPRDCRAAFIEFNHTEGSDDILGPYPPAGPDWQRSIRNDVTQALIGVEMQSPEPHALAGHWGRILDIPVSQNQRGEPELRLANGSLRFVAGASEIMSGLTFGVGEIAAVRQAAKARGMRCRAIRFCWAGLRLVLRREAVTLLIPSLPATNAKRLRNGAKRRSNPSLPRLAMDCFASLAMTVTCKQEQMDLSECHTRSTRSLPPTASP